MSEMHGTITHGAGAHGTPPPHPGQRRSALPLTPARRVALLIGVPVCLALTGYAGLSIVAPFGKGHFRFSHTFAPGARRLSVTGSGGNIVLEQEAAGPARLSGSGYYSLIRPTFTDHASADSATFWYPCHIPIGDCGLTATLSVPVRTAVTISSGGGDVTADHMTGDLTLDTGGGNIQATATTGDVTATTGGGDVTADHATGNLTLNTGGGNIQATATTGDVTMTSGGGDLTASQIAGGQLTLDTDGGNVQATGVAAPRVAAKSGGGDIEIIFTVVPRDVTVSTAGGNVTIVVPRGPARYRVSATTAGGNVTDSTIPLGSSSPNSITATSGGGDITIRLAG